MYLIEELSSLESTTTANIVMSRLCVEHCSEVVHLHSSTFDRKQFDFKCALKMMKIG